TASYRLIDHELAIFSENSSSNKKHNLQPLLSLYFHCSVISRLQSLHSFICLASAATVYITRKVKQRSEMQISTSHAY
uniref:ATP synthase F1 subunit epsilon n=1 Tax=Parascaris univalens TaxID=6257 RepID=A0A915B2B5_PARUN